MTTRLTSALAGVWLAAIIGLVAAETAAAADMMPPWVSKYRGNTPIAGTWVSWPDWRSVVWDGDDKGSALHRRTQAHSLAIENKLCRLHDWSHPSLHPDYEYLYPEMKKVKD
ncbi:MAG TPA: hypothetical protein VM165_20400 [Planctomycetaceae bacterium]|nr:hypothetical protein [Planctomycetaceae bacterium]